VIVGIDYSTYFAHLCLLGDAGPSWRVATFRPVRESGEASSHRAMTRAGLEIRLALGDYLALGDEPTFAIERGYGQSRRADFVLGAFYGVIVSSLSSAFPTGRVIAVEARDWKKAISASCGVKTKTGSPGNATLKKGLAHAYVIQAFDVTQFHGATLPGSIRMRLVLQRRIHACGSLSPCSMSGIAWLLEPEWCPRRIPILALVSGWGKCA
jgi:hypothetical protein